MANCSDFQASNLQISHVPVGIVMSNVDEASITGINFSDTGVAFSVYGSNHIRFANNQLVRSGSWWFSWFAHVSNSVITRNSISPTPYGIGITHGQNITVSENYMSDNIGLYLESSSGILVYHNNFLRPATDYQGGQNRWDNDYPSGGNYWTSFNGVDTCNGPNQDICISGDGIGDTPYVVYFGPDRYPLMKPFAPLVTGSVQFAPTSITSQNSGKYLTANIGLPQGFNASNLIRSSIRLNETITASSVRLVTQPSATPLLIVTFSMTQVKELFSKPGIYTLQLTANLLTNTNFRPFQATATVSLVSS